MVGKRVRALLPLSSVAESPIGLVEAVVAVEEEGAVVFPVGGDGGVPVADPVHLLKVALQEMAAQTFSLEVNFHPEPGDEEPVLRRVCIGDMSA